MNPRLFVLGLLLISITGVSALSIIGATDAPVGSYDRLVLDEILFMSEKAFGDVVSLDVLMFSEVTDDHLETSIVIFVKDGRVLISVPPNPEVMVGYYVEQIESWVASLLPYSTIGGDIVADTSVEDQFAIRCFKSDSGIYEAGVTSGLMPGQTIASTYTDVCVGDLLIEYACENDLVIRLEIPCDGGCSEGACIEVTPADRRGSGSGTPCDTRWLWTRNGFICERLDEDVESVVVVAPDVCVGCVSGERCMIYGDRLPDNLTCTGIGFTCLGCELGSLCIPNRAHAPDGRLCIAGVFTRTAPQPEPEVVVEPPRERQPIEELFVPTEPSGERRGIITIIADFFRNLFRRS